MFNELYAYLPRGRAITPYITTPSILERSTPEVVDALTSVSSKGHVTYILSPITYVYEVKGIPGLGRAIYRLRIYESLRNELDRIRKIKSLGVPIITLGPENLTTEVVRKLEVLRS
ncbi:MAG: hypothetical protein QW267_04555 [Sulfolobales archaeon]